LLPSPVRSLHHSIIPALHPSIYNCFILSLVYLLARSLSPSLTLTLTH
jgi:hypothetical protein